jgi:SAM-dependent methyltransferase
MSVFGNYARYYDLIYRDKDYAGETAYVRALIRKFAPAAKTVLELGCGTAKHAQMLSEDGLSVVGVDMSKDMLEVGKQRIQAAGNDKVRLVEGDARTVRVPEKFDVVISLFHVMSYQVSNADLEAAFATAALHLKPGGVFIFDCWYGPTVMTDVPVVRIKRLEDEAIQVTRLAEPVVYPNENRVDVNYTVFIRDKADGKVEEVKETHHMRYLFKPEVTYFLERQGLSCVADEEWMTKKRPGRDTWGVCFVAVKPG